MDAKPFPVAKASFILAVAMAIAGFVFFVPIKHRPEHSGYGYGGGPAPRSFSKPSFTTWDLIVGND